MSCVKSDSQRPRRGKKASKEEVVSSEDMEITPVLKNAWELRDALNHVGREGVGEGLDDVDAEEAGELFVVRTDRHEFYQL